MSSSLSSSNNSNSNSASSGPNMEEVGYEDCAPTTARRRGPGGTSIRRVKTMEPTTMERRRSSLFHVQGVGTEDEEPAPLMADRSAARRKNRRRNGGRRGSVAHVRATPVPEEEEAEEQHQMAPRRRSFTGLMEAMDSSISGLMEDVSSRYHSSRNSNSSPRVGRRTGGRRSSIFHVNQVDGKGTLEEHESTHSSRSKSRTLKLNPFARKSSTGSSSKSHNKKEKKRSNSGHKKQQDTEKSSEDLLKELEQLARAVQKNPESRKILQQHLQKQQQGPPAYVRAA
ncbi:expressed unknown protein [Seminavis robusta]|uniref:Uncharacterized protein n=1 Tax=Seminavis robusta TaxID=568900 RepID=A0A9N8HYY7_9STRA|nr:expressed unknown protein [Seminavis robusta]|eukprot:Sro2119_g315360.1 n/a (284) ;mRNA; f:10471-11322